MRILVTNDDGVHAPGLAAVTRALAAWAAAGPPAEDRQVVVVAPLANHSGAAAAVGTVYEREAIAYRSVPVPGAEGIPAYGLDASPALSVIVGALGAFGPRPDLVVSGINLGVNVGRSVLHSGTVGAVLTGAQLGLSGLAVSMRSGTGEDRWETAAGLAVALLPALASAPARTVLNLNVPSVPPDELRGVRRGRISTAGLIKAAATTAVHRRPAGPGAGAASDAGAGAGRGLSPGAGTAPGAGPDGDGAAGVSVGRSGHEEAGEVQLTLGPAVPSLGDVGDELPEDDGALVAAGYASLTPLLGVREDGGPGADEVVRRALAVLEERGAR